MRASHHGRGLTWHHRHGDGHSGAWHSLRSTEEGGRREGGMEGEREEEGEGGMYGSIAH